VHLNIFNERFICSIDWKFEIYMHDLIRKNHNNSLVKYAFLQKYESLKQYVNVEMCSRRRCFNQITQKSFKYGDRMNDVMPLLLLPEDVMTVFVGFGIFFTNPYYFFIKDVAEKLITTGLIQNADGNDQKYRKLDKIEKEPQVFSIESLDFGFVLWFGACLASTIVFFVEIIYSRVKTI
jgi:hypothetical protein